MNDISMQTAPEWGAFRRWYFLVAAALAALLLLMWLLGYGPGGSACKLPAAPAVSAAPAPAAAPVPAPAPAPATVVTPAPAVVVAAAAPAAAPAAMAKVVTPPAARVYFGLNKTELPGDVDKTLTDVVAYVKANGGSKASISGFHDPSGDRAHNEALAFNRARAVRDQLDKLGVAGDRVVMQKPAASTGTGPPREARRVEVSVLNP